MLEECSLGHELPYPGADCLQCQYEDQQRLQATAFHKEIRRKTKIWPCGHRAPAIEPECRKCRRAGEREEIITVHMIEEEKRRRLAANPSYHRIAEEEEKRALNLADKAAFRAENFPAGRPPNIHRITETSTGKTITFTIGPTRLPKRQMKRGPKRRNLLPIPASSR